MPIHYLNEVIANTFQIILIGSFFTLASKFILNMTQSFGLSSLFPSEFTIHGKRIAPEKISLSRQKAYRRMGVHKRN